MMKIATLISKRLQVSLACPLLVLPGRYNGWVEDFERAGTPFTSSIDNLHNLLDLLGDLTPVDAFITRTEDEIVAQANLLTAKGVRYTGHSQGELWGLISQLTVRHYQ